MGKLRQSHGWVEAELGAGLLTSPVIPLSAGACSLSPYSLAGGEILELSLQ